MRSDQRLGPVGLTTHELESHLSDTQTNKSQCQLCTKLIDGLVGDLRHGRQESDTMTKHQLQVIISAAPSPQNGPSCAW